MCRGVIMNLLEQIQTSGRFLSLLQIAEIMERANILDLVRLTTSLQHTYNLRLIQDTISKDDDCNSIEKVNETVSAFLPMAEQLCGEYPLPATSIAVRLFKADLESLDRSRIADRIRLLRDTLAMELDASTFLYMEPHNVKLFWEPYFGWDAILAAIPVAKEDVVELNRCRACSRYTASVMHLCRVIEFAFKEFADKNTHVEIKGQVERSSWEQLANDIKESRDKAKSKGVHSNELDKLDAVRTQIILLKELWRNPIMHSPGTFYNEEQVSEIYETAKGLIRLLVLP